MSTTTAYDDDVALSIRALMAAVRLLSGPVAGLEEVGLGLGEALGAGSAAAKRALPGGSIST